MSISKELVAASATPLVLSILAEGDNYGYAIIKRVRRLSDGKLQWTDGMLYPVLHRLEKQQLIESYQQTAPNGRKRKYYRLKDPGSRALAEHKSQWTAVHAANLFKNPFDAALSVAGLTLLRAVCWFAPLLQTCLVRRGQTA